MNQCLACGKSVKNKFCNTSCQNKIYNKRRTIKKIQITSICKKCSNEFRQVVKSNGKGYMKQFCTRKCSNAREQTPEVRLKRSQALLGKYKGRNITPREVRMCKNPLCSKTFEVRKSKGKKFCCRRCNSLVNGKLGARLAGLKSASLQYRRSKNEICFADLCKEHFNNVKTNIAMFNGWDADVIIEDCKTAVLWNGKWHYEKIKKNHSVLQVQNRDKIKISEIIKAGYIPYVIKDMGSYDPKFVKEKFEEFISRVGQETRVVS